MKYIVKINTTEYGYDMYINALLKCIDGAAHNWQNRMCEISLCQFNKPDSYKNMSFTNLERLDNIINDILDEIEIEAERMLEREQSSLYPNRIPILKRVLQYVCDTHERVQENVYNPSSLLWDLRNYPINDYVDMTEYGNFAFWYEPELQYHDKPNKTKIDAIFAEPRTAREIPIKMKPVYEDQYINPRKTYKDFL